MKKGFNYVTVQNRPCVIEYKGEHYVVRHRSGRTVRPISSRSSTGYEFLEDGTIY